MCKVVLTDEGGMYRTCFVSDETPRRILSHFQIEPKTKEVYINGTLLTDETMYETLPNNGVVHMMIKSKTIRR